MKDGTVQAILTCSKVRLIIFARSASTNSFFLGLLDCAGSCGLTYSLVRVSQHSQTSSDHDSSFYSCTYPILINAISGTTRATILSSFLDILLTSIVDLYIPVVLFVIYLLITRLFPSFISPSRTNRQTPGGPGWGGGGGGSTRGGGPTSSDSHARYGAPPPPYTKYNTHPSTSPNPTQTGGTWAPGFWTGAWIASRWELSSHRPLNSPYHHRFLTQSCDCRIGRGRPRSCWVSVSHPAARAVQPYLRLR